MSTNTTEQTTQYVPQRPPPIDLSQFQTISLIEAAKTLGIGRTHAYRLVKAGHFPVPVRRINSSWRVRIKDLEAFWQV